VYEGHYIKIANPAMCFGISLNNGL
jgi:hypothetical protein